MRRLLGAQGGLLSRLAFVEIRTYRDSAGHTLLVPAVPLQTEIVKREVLVREDDSSIKRIPERMGTGKAALVQPALKVLTRTRRGCPTSCSSAAWSSISA
jgi:hypothetical protein